MAVLLGHQRSDGRGPPNMNKETARRCCLEGAVGPPGRRASPWARRPKRDFLAIVLILPIAIKHQNIKQKLLDLAKKQNVPLTKR